MTTFHFAVDLGATSGRTILAAYDGKRIEMREISRFKYPMLPLNNHLFWNLPQIYQYILDGLKLCRNALKEFGDGNATLSSIGIDSWGCDVAYFYKDGSLAGLPYCYRDSHTEGAVDRFCKRVPKKDIYARTGTQFMDINTLFQLDTLRLNSPDVLDSADKILFMPDAIAYMLTGIAVTEYTIASTSQLLNPATGDLDEILLDRLGLTRDKFGPMVMPGHMIGRLCRQVGESVGLGEVPVIAVAGHDTASAVIAVPSQDKEFAYLSCGTWSLLGIESPVPIINDRSCEYNFTNEGGIDGTTRFLKNICGLWLFERCREEMDNVPEDISEFAALYRDSVCDSVIDPDDPSFAHPAKMTLAIDEYCVRTNQEKPCKPADYIRIIYRSLAKRYKDIIGQLREFSPVEIRRLHVIGGGSQNGHLMQMTANETGLPVVAGPKECTAMGNILVQLRGLGELKDLAEMRRISINSTETITYQPIGHNQSAK